MANRQQSQIVLAWLILAYLSIFPLAGDTVAGIARYWFVAEGIEIDMAVAALSVEQSVLAGWLTVLNMPGRKPVYILNAAYRPLLKYFLNDPGSIAVRQSTPDSTTPTATPEQPV